MRKVWVVKGMHCSHCELTVRKAIEGLPGLTDVSVSYRSAALVGDWKPELLREADLRSALQAEGYDIDSPSLFKDCLRLLGLLLVCALLFCLFRNARVSALLSSFPMAESGMSLAAVFLVGVLTSLHCIAMCGGINLSQSCSAAGKNEKIMAANLQYNLGRVISYTVIGCIVGGLGAALSISHCMKAAIQLAAALLMVLMAAILSGFFPFLQRFALLLPRKGFSRVRFGKSSLLVGLANGLMPCGPLQSMQLYALSAGSILMGGLSMLCFALGTVPLMLLFGFLGGRLNARFGKPMQIVSSVIVLMMGISMLVNGVSLMGAAAAPAESDLPTAVISSDGSLQTITTELDYNSYPAFRVKAGIPVEWTLHADGDKLIGCNNEILIPAYNLDIPLHEGDNVITFTPGEAGVIPFSCWMGMIRSSITVTD